MSGQRFRSAVEARDHAAMVAVLHDDVVLHSPVAFEPFRSKAVVGRVLGVLLNEVFEEFRYTDEFDGGDAHALIFRATVGSRELEGLDLLRFGADGLIRDFTVMVRPLSAVVALRDAMAPHNAFIVDPGA